MASKGKTMADSSYESEVSGVQAFLSMQHGKGDATPLSPGQVQGINTIHVFVCSDLSSGCINLQPPKVHELDSIQKTSNS